MNNSVYFFMYIIPTSITLIQNLVLMLLEYSTLTSEYSRQQSFLHHERGVQEDSLLGLGW